MEEIAHGGIMGAKSLRVQAPAMSEEAGGQDAGVIQYEEVIRPKKFWKIPESGVAERTGAAIDVEHAGGGAICQWLLGNQLLGEMEIEL
jgi:hypothetical protein